MTGAVERIRKVQLGCGLNTPAGWIHVDGSWNARFAKYPLLRGVLGRMRVVPASLLEIPWSRDILIHDVRKPLPFEDASLDAVYASHLLEHLYLDEAQRLLRECLRVLAPGGVLRVVVPDLRTIVADYVERIATSGREEAGDRLNQRLLLRSPRAPAGNAVYRIYSGLKEFHSHKWMYDADSLQAHFRDAGFKEVTEMQFHQSRIAGIEAVEHADRVLNGEGICVEGVKPRS